MAIRHSLLSACDVRVVLVFSRGVGFRTIPHQRHLLDYKHPPTAQIAAIWKERNQTFIADAHRSEAARQAATDVLNHFDVVSGMATEKTPNTMRTYGASTTYASEFGDRTDSAAISKKDLELLQGNYTDDELKSLLSEAKTKNVQAGIFLIGMGACLTASGAALTAGFLGAAPVGWVAVPATALLAYGGVMSVGVGIDSLVSDESAQLTSQWTKRQDAIASWS